MLHQILFCKLSNSLFLSENILYQINISFTGIFFSNDEKLFGLVMQILVFQGILR